MEISYWCISNHQFYCLKGEMAKIVSGTLQCRIKHKNPDATKLNTFDQRYFRNENKITK